MDCHIFHVFLLVTIKSSITYVDSHNYTKIKVDSDDDLLLKETFSLHNVFVLIKSVFNKNHNQYYYKTL